MVDDDDNSKKKPNPQAFTARYYTALKYKIQDLRCTQLGALMDPWSSEDLIKIFVAPTHRSALRHVYDLEDAVHAKGEIFLNLLSVLREQAPDGPRVFDEGEAEARMMLANMRFYFHRDWQPDAFVTPSPVFGTRENPIHDLPGMPREELRIDFLQRCLLFMQTACQWYMVEWVLDKLQISVRTPQQVRYVWPCIHTLTRMAEIDLDLATTSSRAGMNATPDPICRPYLKATNDIVANSVLLGVQKEHINRYNRGVMSVSQARISTTTPGIVVAVGN